MNVDYEQMRYTYTLNVVNSNSVVLNSALSFSLEYAFLVIYYRPFRTGPRSTQTIPLVLLVTLVPIYWQTTTNQGSTTVETGSNTLKSFTHGSCWISWFTANRFMSKILQCCYSQLVQQFVCMLYDSFDQDYTLQWQTACKGKYFTRCFCEILDQKFNVRFFSSAAGI